MVYPVSCIEFMKPPDRCSVCLCHYVHIIIHQKHCVNVFVEKTTKFSRRNRGLRSKLRQFCTRLLFISCNLNFHHQRALNPAGGAFNVTDPPLQRRPWLLERVCCCASRCVVEFTTVLALGCYSVVAICNPTTRGH